ncbi:MAG: HAD hydrolase family protein [Coriobacteriia bacterium]|nr:HAD hydrolase family protein [Coriobacteriia bacterium]
MFEPIAPTELAPVFPEGCLPVASPEACALLANVRVIYTDLDGTLLAPGGRLLADHKGRPSAATAEALVALKTAGITVIPVTGRGADQGSEFLRLLNLDCYIGEVGGYILRRQGVGIQVEERYVIGEWEQLELAPGLAPGELPAGVNPYEFIGQSGVIKRLLAAFPEMLFTYPAPRSVSWSLWGNVDVAAAAGVLAREELPLQLLDNGLLYHPPGVLPDGLPAHIYHLLPAGVTKRLAIAEDRAFHEAPVSATVAIGDSAIDLEMSEACGIFVMMANGLRNPAVQETVAARIAAGQTILHTTQPTVDGWAEFAQACLSAL